MAGPYYWVGGSGNWSDATNHWATASGGVPNAANVPDSTSDVHFDAGSNTTNAAYTVTVNATANCKDLMFDAKPGDGAGGTITCAGPIGISVYGSVTLLAGMTYSNTGGWTLAATTPGKTITSNGVTLGNGSNFNVTCAGIGGGWTLQDAFSITSGIFRLNQGAFDSNSKIMQVGALSLDGSSSTRSFTAGTSVITASSGGGALTVGTAAGLTFSGASATFNVTGIMNTYGQTFGTVNHNAGATNNTITGAFTATNVTITGRANKTDAAYTSSAGFTVTGTLKLRGNSEINSMLFQGVTPGTPVTITAAAIDATSDFVHFMDVTIAGAAAPFAVGTRIGDCGGNSGITFTTAATQTATGTASFTWSTHGWTSRVPLPQDDVAIPNAFIAGRTITADMPRLGKNITFSCTGSPAFTPSQASSIYGSLTLASGMTWGGSQTFSLSGRGSHTLLSAGVTVPTSPMYMSGIGGTYTMQDALTVNRFVLAAGTFNTNGYAFTSAYMHGNAGGTYTRNITLGASTITLTGNDSSGSAAPWNAGGTGITVSAGTSTIKLTESSYVQKTFAGGNFAYNNVWFSGTGYGSFFITGSNTFNQLKSDNPLAPVQITAGTTQTVADWQLNGCEIASGFTNYHTDHEGIARTKKSGEVVVHGKRRVENQAALSGASISGTGTTPVLTFGQPDPDGGNNAVRVQCSIAAGTTTGDISFYSWGGILPNRTFSRSMMIKNNGGANTSLITKLSGATVNDVVTFDNTWKRFSPVNVFSAILSANYIGIGLRGSVANGTIDILLYDMMWEDVSFQSNQNPSERVKVDDASTGAVGVHYYDTLNGNTVDPTTRVVTEAVGAAITPLATQCALQPVISSSSASSFTITKSGATDLAARWMWLQRATATANGRTYYAGAASKDGGSNVNWTWLNAPAELDGDAAAVAVASGALNAGIALAGVALSVAGAGGTLTTAIPLSAVAVAVSAADGILNAQITLAGDALSEAAAAAGLDTAVVLAGDAGALGAASGTLTVQIVLSGEAAAAAGAGGDLTAQVQISAAAIAQALASGSLTTEIPLAAFAMAQASVVADFVTRPRIRGYRLEASAARLTRLTSSAARITQLLSRDARIEQ